MIVEVHAATNNNKNRRTRNYQAILQLLFLRKKESSISLPNWRQRRETQPAWTTSAGSFKRIIMSRDTSVSSHCTKSICVSMAQPKSNPLDKFEVPKPKIVHKHKQNDAISKKSLKREESKRQGYQH